MKFVKSLLFAITLCMLPFQSNNAEAATTKMIVISSTGFMPEQLTFTKGEEVQLIVNNTDQTVHNLVIPELLVKVPHLMKGEMAVSNFIANRTGSFSIFSDAPGYKEIGFKGTVIVK